MNFKTLGRSSALLVATLLCTAPALADPVSVTDDDGHEIRLEQPAERIVSLAPHITEVLFAVGAGDKLVGATQHSDFPPEAEMLPRVGGYSRIDMERVVQLDPDLVVAWRSGNSQSQIEHLRELGFHVYVSEPRSFDGVAASMRRMAQLAGTETQGDEAVRSFEEAIDTLRQDYAERDPVRLFYQVWEQPLMTVNDDHLISEAIRLCGGVNVFGHLDRLVPRMDREAVIEADPEVIIGGGMGEDRPDWVIAWTQWEDMTAVQRDNLFFIPPSLLQRHTPRIAEGTRLMCEELERARLRRVD
ncbi:MULTISPECIES: cobalamin-binding protein [unclassified Thioalkalivibrio]|uniref:cobalamin-binding protein n=1 Tax=unclassified Thioalkalivibrio TaxID=2621013 RepID=UPI00035DB71F|nr:MULTISPECIES: cobalamin-binding protein [unclassified Thioalkalivibrio]